MNTALLDVELQAIFTCIHEIAAAPHLPAALKAGLCRTTLESGDRAAAAAVVCGILSAADDRESAQALLENCGARPRELRSALEGEEHPNARRWSALLQALLDGLPGRASPAT